MRKRLFVVLAALLIVSLAGAILGRAEAEESTKGERKRARIDQRAQETLSRLFKESPKSKELYDRAHGYAVFTIVKVSLAFTGGGGGGVALEKGTNRRIYMKMATGGLNLGLGGQRYRVVFLFENKSTFDSFVEKGWQAEASANAVAGRAGANAEANFRNGMAVYQLTQAGLMLQADISGTKYWKNENLNVN